jgi:hypothetical protein
MFELYMTAGSYVQAFAFQGTGRTIGVHRGSEDRTHIVQLLRGV